VLKHSDFTDLITHSPEQKVTTSVTFGTILDNL